MTVTATRHYPPRPMKNGALLLMEKPKTSHPDEPHIKVALASHNGKYVTWIFSEEDGSACWGHYFEGHEFGKALADFNSRGIPSEAQGY